MTKWVRITSSHGLIAAIAAAALLAGCGGKKQAVTGNAVQMRDLEVVDGTANDAMTDLDAVQADGVGAADNAGNGSGHERKAKAPDAEAVGKDAESVASE